VRGPDEPRLKGLDIPSGYLAAGNGSAQPGHRQAFWIAARRWTMRAVEAGLLNVDCLKVS